MISGVIRHDEIVIDGTRLHFAEAGSGPVIVLVHGFPEFWFSWREQIPVLAEAGFRVVALDLRGYNLSHRPREIDAYTPGEVGEELARFIEQVGAPVFLVGHDWGAIACWTVAIRHPELLRKLVIVNIPHPSAFRATPRRVKQMLMLSYQLFFQLPALPEWALSARRFALLRKLMKTASRRKSALTDEILAEYETAWERPGALTAMLNYYRAIRRQRGSGGGAGSGKIDVPTLLIWGRKEPVFLAETIAASAQFVTDFRLEALPRAGHFAQQDEPEKVNRLLIEFFGS